MNHYHNEVCVCCGNQYRVAITQRMSDSWIECPKCGYERGVAIRHYKVVHYMQ